MSKKFRKWSEQIVVDIPVNGHDADGCENGVEKKTDRVLMVCNSGMGLFRREFAEKKYRDWDKDLLPNPFEFVVLSGDLCTDGMFWELTYRIGENDKRYHALVQVCDAVTDIRIVLGALHEKGLLPDGFKTHKAWLREDIDAVHVCGCSRDETGEAVCMGGIYRAKRSEMSLKRYCERQHGACLYYYRGDHREVWCDDDCKWEPVFVSGSENVRDKEFEEIRRQDNERLEALMREAEILMDDYNLPYFLIYSAYGVDEGKKLSAGASIKMSRETIEGIVREVYRDNDDAVK